MGGCSRQLPRRGAAAECVHSRLRAPANATAAAAAAAPVFFEDMKFAPNVINTAVFLLSTAQQACTFVINYAGAPFMQPLTENIMLWRGFQVTYLVLLLAASGLSSTLLSWLQLVPLPPHLRAALIALILADVACCGALEYGLRTAYGVGRRL